MTYMLACTDAFAFVTARTLESAYNIHIHDAYVLSEMYVLYMYILMQNQHTFIHKRVVYIYIYIHNKHTLMHKRVDASYCLHTLSCATGYVC